MEEIDEQTDKNARNKLDALNNKIVDIPQVIEGQTKIRGGESPTAISQDHNRMASDFFIELDTIDDGKFPNTAQHTNETDMSKNQRDEISSLMKVS